MPSLSEIERLDTGHLTRLGSDFAAEADRIQHGFAEVHARLGATNWEGGANDAALQRTDADRLAAHLHAERLHTAARIARFGDEAMQAARRRILDTVDAVRSDGFTVKDDLSVKDRQRSETLEELADRQRRAHEFAAELREQAAALVTMDHDIAAELRAAMSGVGDVTFGESPILGDSVPLDTPGPGPRRWTGDDLYPHDPTASDIHQDGIGDCFFVSTAGAIANANPQWIKDRIRYDDKTGDFDVTLFDGHQWKHIPVTQDDIATDIARQGGSWLDNGHPDAPLWPSVLESAYAKSKYPDRSLEWALSSDGIGKGGATRNALEALTGNRGTSINPRDVWLSNHHLDQDITTALANHQPVTISTTSEGNPLVSKHAYMVEGITGVGSDAQVTLRNPWAVNTNTPLNVPGPLVTVRLGDLIGSGVPDPFGGTHPTSDVNIGSLG